MGDNNGKAIQGDNNGKAIIDASAHFIAGWVSGCAGVLVSHPFDTVKVRLQTQGVIEGAAHQYRGTWHCLVDTVKREKFRGLFKGMSSPILGTALWNSVVFGAYGNTVKFLAGNNIEKQHEMKSVFIGSLAAGVAQCTVVCPLELTKTRLQIQSCETSTLYKGLIDCVRQIYHKAGFLGLYNGIRATFYRDMIGFPTYFCSFELLCRAISNNNPPYTDMGVTSLIIAGGTAGAFSWACAFPCDVIKCRIQVDYNGQYNGFKDCLVKSYKKEGNQLFQRGFIPTVLRGFPMNAAIFSIYMISIRFYEEREIGERCSLYLSR